MCQIKLEDVGGESCEPVGGLTSKILIAPWKDFTTLVDPPASMDGAEVETLATIVGPHIAAAPEKGFRTWEGVEWTGTFKCTGIGEVGRRAFQNEAVITIAGSSKKLLGTLRAIKNMKVIALLEEAGTGQLRQLGSKKFGALFSGIEHAIEAAMTGANSVTLTIQDTQLWPAPIYEGAVPMAA